MRVVYRTLEFIGVAPADGLEMRKTLADRSAPLGRHSGQLHFIQRCNQGLGVSSETRQLSFEFIDL